jgi:bifunctional non-homologous end joining protein LigD
MDNGRDDDVVLCVFDLPYLSGYDLSQVPLVERKNVLQKLVQTRPSERIRYSDHIVGEGDRILKHACRYALEGVVSKRIDSLYEGRRSPDWIKLKCRKRQEFVIGGWSDPRRSREGLGALLLGYYQDKSLNYCGRVGTGFSQQSLVELRKRLEKIAANTSPFKNSPRGRDARGVHWVLPRLVAEIEFASWTNDGRLRQASFEGLREDKVAQEVVLERSESSHGRLPRAKKSPTS